METEQIDLTEQIVSQAHLAEEKPLTEDDRQQMWLNIGGRTIYRHGRRRLLWWFSGAAAAAAVLAGVWLLYNNVEPTPQIINYQSYINAATSEGDGDVRLVTSDEKILEISDAEAELIYDHKGNLNYKATDSVAIRETAPRQEAKEKTEANKSADKPLHLNTLTAPYGKRANVVLSDGTKIWLNSGSTLIYPSVFEGATREIYLEGEMFLEIAKDASHPFIVKTASLETLVTGTSFNIRAYKDERRHAVALVTGSVMITPTGGGEHTNLLPNRLFDYDVKNGHSAVSEVDVLDHICWKYGFLHFRNEPLPAVIERLHRYYNIDFEYDLQKIKHITVSGKLDLKDSVYKVFSTVALTAGVKYKIMENKILINND